MANFSDHVRLYAQAPAWPRVRFLLGDEAAGPEFLSDPCYETPVDELDECLKLLRPGGHEVVAFNLTPHSLADAGLYVTRAVISGLVPLFVGQWHALGHNRLQAALGRSKPGESSGPANPYPHPFP